MPTTHVRGIDLHYETHGSEGPCLVIAHGALSSIAHTELLGLQAARFGAEGFRVVAYDARGHGRSGYTASLEHYRPAALAEDLRCLMDALSLAEVCIYGTSMGASTALMLALAQPKRVRRLVLRSPSPFGVDIDAARARLYPLASMYRWLGGFVTAHAVALSSRPSERSSMKTLLSGQQRGAVVPAIRGFLSEPIDPGVLAQIEAPTLILTHPGDPIHPLRSGQILRERLPNAKLMVAPSRSSWEDRERLLQVVVASLKGQPIEGAR
jgi:pimeloyl-ACP methyl ester carboxylesterase